MIAAAEAILLNWLTWIDGVGAPDGNGWKVPAQFSEFGFTYGAYDPGQTAAIALGCLFIYLRNGHDLAATWARRLLDDLRENRLDPVFGGYKSDYHYAWLNSLVLRAFGLAVSGRGRPGVCLSGHSRRPGTFRRLDGLGIRSCRRREAQRPQRRSDPFCLQRGGGYLGIRPELSGHESDGDPGGGDGHAGRGPGVRQGNGGVDLVAAPAGLCPGGSPGGVVPIPDSLPHPGL